MIRLHFLCLAMLYFTNLLPLAGQFKPVAHRKPTASEKPVYGPGSYAEPGTTYVLMNDVSSDRSTIFLGKDVTLDLNGYTVKYADGQYEHITNSGFEQGLTGWDISKAPGAKIMNTADIHVFVGDKLVSLEAGDEITSSFVHLPVSNRSYVAMCGITGRHFTDAKMKSDLENEMKVSVFVEDEFGHPVTCNIQYMDSAMLGAPVEKRSPRLGGGYVYAHLTQLPAGKYRVRVRADTDCLVDEIDIRPAMDVGIAIVGRTYARGHYDHLHESKFAAFFDYTSNVSTGEPLASVPVVKGAGTITIKNGTVENAAVGAISWGIQSTADDVRMILDNVEIKTAGINTISVDVPQSTISNCRFEVKSPFMINRHGSNFYNVDLRGDKASEVSFSSFYGGQGCLVFKGKHSRIHHNFFANNQAVTNHYSIMAMGDSSQIFENHIEPERGSGIEIYTKKYIDIFNNLIKVRSSPPTCEYGTEEYSANAIRIADYRAKPGSEKGAFGNRVYNNKIFIKAINFETPKEYIPLCWAVFYSASGGDNYIFGNEINIEHTAPGTKALATAFFISGGTEGFGGEFYNNRITTNIPAIWTAAKYGGTVNTKVYNNLIIKSAGSASPFSPVRMGFQNCKDCIAKHVEFVSNKIENDSFNIHIEGQGHSFSVAWKLDITVKDKLGKAVANAMVTVVDKMGKEQVLGKTSEAGKISCTLKQYDKNQDIVTQFSPYIVRINDVSKQVELKSDTAIEILLGKKKGR
jgi:hypothetical protein